MEINRIRADHFPVVVADGCEVRPVDEATFWEIVGELSAEVFTPLSELGLAEYRPPSPTVGDAWQVHREWLMFHDADDRPIGWSFSEQREADTLFMVWTGLVPDVQNRGIYSAFLRHFLAYAKALGYARVTSTHMVNNRRVLVAKLKAGFVASGMTLDERWGAMIGLTCHLDDDLAGAYRNAFSLERYD